MENEKKLKRKNVLSIVWVVLIVAVVVFIVKNRCLWYEENDDFFMGLIPSGFFGKYNYHLVHGNIIIGIIVSFLSAVYSGVNWLTVMYLILIFGSYILCGIGNVQRNKSEIGFLQGLLIFLSTIYSLTVGMNYSKTGGIAMAVSVMVLVSAIDQEKTNKKLVVMSAILTVLGGIIRTDVTIAMAPFILLLGIYIFQKYRKEFLKKILPLGIVIVVIAMCWGINTIAYLDKDWNYYNEFDAERIKILDYQIPDYELNQEAYQKLGISYNDYHMLLFWNFADDSVFNPEVLRGIQKIQQDNLASGLLKKNNSHLVEEFLKVGKRYPILQIVLILFLLVIIINPTEWIYPLCGIVLMAGEILYLIYRGRYPERSVMIAAYGALAVLIYFMKIEDKNKKIRNIFGGGLILLCIYSYYVCGFNEILQIRYEGESPSKAGTIAFLSVLKSNSDALYVWDIEESTYILGSAFEPMDGYPFAIHSNVVFSGGWMVPSPIMGDIMEPFGEKRNAFKLLATNENVYLITIPGMDYTLITNYIREHYNPEAELVVVENIMGLDICSFTK